MTNNMNILNKAKEEINYELFLNKLVFRLGFGYANIGTYYFKELIKMVYIENMQIEKFSDLCNELSKRLDKKDYLYIKRNINSTTSRIDIDKAKESFYDIFNIEFDEYFLTPKHLTILIINTLNSMYKN